ncbi:YlbF family regulator [Paenibacillus xylaniclasticus]|uniref:YlbF family regulator n=1 Tax=Paenibacillus xylaniclasticus TaxID=588083 RepID=UPI0035A23FD5
MGELDTTELMVKAYELGELINHSAEVADYLYWKSVVDSDADVQAVVKQFAKAREQFQECERFGRFHPDYNAAKDRMKEVQAQLDTFESVKRFKAAEQVVDSLLYDVSRLIADAVSETVKVPGNDPNPKGGGCGGGGSCGCGSGGCG